MHARARASLPGGTDSNFRAWGDDTVYVDRGKGGRIWDIDGNEFIDLRMGYGPVILGHADPRVDDAVAKAARKGVSFSLTTEDEVRVAELIKAMTGWVELARMTVSGTEATMHAIRVARAYTRHDKIVKFEGQYHGVHDYALISVLPNDVSTLGAGTILSGWHGAEAYRTRSRKQSSRLRTTISRSCVACLNATKTTSRPSSWNRYLATRKGSCLRRDSSRASAPSVTSSARC
jgi:glutamate-1-semialdehyde aminotransferase